MNNLSKTVLLVEDDSITALLERKMLERNNYEVLTAETGEKAVETVKNNADIDLILMDIDLGDGIDGTEAAEIILKDHDLPLIFLSSHTEPEVVEKTEGITSYGYIVKNSGETVLMASIRMAFKLFGAKKERDLKERALKNSEERYRLQFMHMTTCNSMYEVVTDKDGKPNDFRFLMVNPAYENFVGVKNSEIVGRTLLEVFPETETYWVDVMTQVSYNGIPVQFENYSQVLDTYLEIKIFSPQKGQLVMTSEDISLRKKAEKALKESEDLSRKKIQAILEPKGDIGVLSLGEIIDSEELQSIMEVFYQITKIPVALVDMAGQHLAYAGWQDICVKFHRSNPESFRNCHEAATKLAEGVSPRECKAYKCKNNLWDVVTPINIDGKHMGNIFLQNEI